MCAMSSAERVTAGARRTTNDERRTTNDQPSSLVIGRSSFVILLLIAAGFLLRLLWLSWQPLWWDEGYSVYFATEPVARMIWLTAHDIHPPLYYALLHSWLALFQSAQPIVLRLFSGLAGLISLPLFAALAHTFFPQRPRLIQLALLLLAVNPMHLFYSQEVRMYGLAMALGIISTIFFWQIIKGLENRADKRIAYIGYIISSALALYTLYYTAFLFVAHLLWASWHFRRRLRKVGTLLLADTVIALLYAPWLAYAAPKLVAYVGSKVQSDQDQPLTLLNYLGRHLIAFTAGQLMPDNSSLRILNLVGLVVIIPLIFAIRSLLRPPTDGTKVGPVTSPAPYAALWTFLLVPIAIGFLVNLRYPFFPDGGERLLLFVLPYFLLLVAAAIEQSWQQWRMGLWALLGLLISALVGIDTFYTTPRYAEHDYRPLIQQVVQQGTDNDTVFAIFPWQVGYWRAYAPANGLTVEHGPWPVLVAEGALTWNAALQQALETMLARGTVWFPAPLSFGSSLPAEVEHYLAAHATNLENVWYSTATRLSAWQPLPSAPLQPSAAEFGSVRLTGAGVEPHEIASANQPLQVRLAWQISDVDQSLGVTLRLQDGTGHTWASRDYDPLGSLSNAPDKLGGSTDSVAAASTAVVDQVGLIVPVGLPPGTYELAVGLTNGVDTLLQPTPSAATLKSGLIKLAAITVMQPPAPLPAFRLPVETAATPPVTTDGVTLLGSAGYHPGDELLAGDAVALTLFLQIEQPPLSPSQLYVSLLDKNGAGVAGWEGWPLDNYPLAIAPAGALLQAPVTVNLPATLPTGEYRLIAGLMDPDNGEKSAPAMLAGVRVRQRVADFVEPVIAQPLPTPAQFGTHALLLGYDYTQNDTSLVLQLHWQVLQTLFPAHHIFVHLDAPDGKTLAQDDRPPNTAAGRASTSSWLPGEYITTYHTVPLPAARPPDAVLRTGLYLPDTGERLPVSIAGVTAGDFVEIQLDKIK